MEIHALRVTVTEDDLNRLVVRLLEHSGAARFRNVKVRVASDGLHVTGSYRRLIPVPFEVVCRPSVHAGDLTVLIAEAKAGPIRAEAIKDQIAEAVAKAVAGRDWIVVNDLAIRLRLEHLFEQNGFVGRMNLRDVTCTDGQVTVVAGAA